MRKQLLSNEEVEFLAEAFIKLQEKPEFQKLSKTFQAYIDEYLEEQINTVKFIMERRNINRKEK